MIPVIVAAVIFAVILAMVIAVTADRHQNARAQTDDQRERDQNPYPWVVFHVYSPFYCL